jgi:hypothetical protein
MLPMRCKYYYTGYGVDPSWEDGMLLQFVALSHSGVVGVVFSDNGGGLLQLKLGDIRLDRDEVRLAATVVS